MLTFLHLEKPTGKYKTLGNVLSRKCILLFIFYYSIIFNHQSFVPEWKSLLVSLKTKKCFKFCIERENVSFQNVGSLICSLVVTSGPPWPLSLSSLSASPSEHICLFVLSKSRDFILSFVSRNPSTNIHCLQGKTQTFRALHRQY